MKKVWGKKRLGDFCTIVSGGTPSKSNPEFWHGDLPFVTARDLKSDRINDAFLRINSKAVLGSSTKIAQPGSILMLVRGMGLANGIQAGEVATKVAFNQDIRAIIPDPGSMTPRFMLLYLRNCFDAEECYDLLSSAAHGTLKIDADALRRINIPLPPLDEQRRIVGILDEAFAGIATARANAEKNLRNARELFESHLNAIFTQRGEGWVEKRLGDVVTRLTNGYVGPTRNIYQETGIPYLLARHVKDNRLQFDGKTYITEEFNRKNKKSILKVDDVLLVQSGHIGHSAVVTKEHEGHNCHAMIVISASKGAFFGSYLSLFFNTSEMKQKFQEIRSGSTVPHLTCGEVKELIIPLPDLEMQKQIVEHAQEIHTETQRLARTYERKLAALDELKKSLLHQAFSGEL